ncbi:MAG: ATP-dependent DNA helicase RecG [Parcubacteria group bacterium GW2011_GWB1_43_8]|nr:MAG: ATP-dependent DNA helicase RecG [Parcubacteria group bacterium GW2011_GWB1_43_8]
MELNSSIEKEFRLSPRQKTALGKLGLKTIKDLLFYFPSRYENFSERKNIVSLAEGDKTTIFGEVLEASLGKTWRKHMSISEISVGDNTGIIKAVWFHQPYMAKIINIGDKVALTGKISRNKSGLFISNPDFEKISAYEALGEGSMILPVYPETSGITSRWMRFAIQRILNSLKENIADPIPKDILKKYHLPSLKSSLVFIHKPRKLKDAEAARKRLAFEEIFFIQLDRLKQRKEREKHHSLKINFDQEELEKFLSSFPFKLTGAQKNAVSAVAEDMRKNSPMSRLLEGDVGSGKTAVAIAAAYLAISAGYQAAYMAPTEILAGQHFQSFIEYFSELRLTPKIGLITSSGCQKFPSKVNPREATKISKAQLLKWVAGGEIPILIGTHSLIQDSVKFKNLALVIIDEQHRFGTRQRASLAINKSEIAPHLLSMTATPIPRTLALTVYGDLDLSLLDELPAGRKSPITKIINPEERETAYSMVREEINKGRQAYIICPRIDEPASSAGKPDPEKEMAILAKSVKEEAKRLKKEIFPEWEIGILHGKMTPFEKENVLSDFKDNKIQILVATSVVEVGINVPNATIIIIEGAERFGLAQLHQLRGRVIRSSYQPYCFIFAESRSQKTTERLKALTTAKNGFELAEYDLKIRGAGELGGGKQWGVSDIGMEALRNIKMVEAARTESQKIIAESPDMEKYPLLAQALKNKTKQIHFE